jgi:membrane associated rhomboid family serine protease
LILAFHISQPDFNPGTYFLIAPWLHGGTGHIIENIPVLIVFGSWMENRVERRRYTIFTLAAAYGSLYFPPLFQYGGFSKGASGLTKALIAYASVCLVVYTAKEVNKGEFSIRVVASVVALFFTIPSIMRTTMRFFHLMPRPEGIAIGAHFTGILFGLSYILISNLNREWFYSMKNWKTS